MRWVERTPLCILRRRRRRRRRGVKVMWVKPSAYDPEHFTWAEHSGKGTSLPSCPRGSAAPFPRWPASGSFWACGPVHKAAVRGKEGRRVRGKGQRGKVENKEKEHLHTERATRKQKDTQHTESLWLTLKVPTVKTGINETVRLKTQSVCHFAQHTTDPRQRWPYGSIVIMHVCVSVKECVRTEGSPI